MSHIPKVILLIEKSRAFGRGLLKGIVEYSNLHGPWLFCMEPQVYQKGSLQSFSWMRSLGADGLIAHTWDRGVIKVILDLGLPAMVCGIQEPVGRVCRIVTDEVAVGRMAAEYLLGRGFRRFAYCGFEDVIWSRSRQENFCRTVTDAGYPVFVYCRPRARRSYAPGQEQPIIADWLRTLPRPIALMAGNDDRAQDVLAACKIAGFAVPNEVAILGVDNDELVCGLSYPQLSSIALGTERAGFEAARILDRLMHGQLVGPNDRQVHVLPTHVVTRHSTDIFAVEDREVAEAVRFIHAHSRQPIQVSDVAKAVGLSKRTLQQRFRHVLSRSVHQEIQSSRVNQMAQLLINTNLTVFQIATLLGYPDASNLSRCFRRQMGMNPSAYRKKMGLPNMLQGRTL
ncbi:MAG: DNA-binding transcriptional regulator [Sedimentisphaerales bacterium]|nr:DNA-binding transcriptional regulator [Sedimentisphaerales bacterium]